MASIQDWVPKIKVSLDRVVGDWGLPVLIILVGLASFGLGRLSAFSEARPAISVREAVLSEASIEMPAGGLVLASKTGNAYHYPWCPGADTIKESNKIWFSSEDEAQKAGYKPAKNCEGLQ